MVSKFRNLIASKVRQQMMASGCLNQGSKLPQSLHDLKVKMRLEASPNLRSPFWINLQFPWETKQQNDKKMTPSQKSIRSLQSFLFEQWEKWDYPLMF